MAKNLHQTHGGQSSPLTGWFKLSVVGGIYSVKFVRAFLMFSVQLSLQSLQLLHYQAEMNFGKDENTRKNPSCTCWCWSISHDVGLARWLPSPSVLPAISDQNFRTSVYQNNNNNANVSQSWLWRIYHLNWHHSSKHHYYFTQQMLTCIIS